MSSVSSAGFCNAQGMTPMIAVQRVAFCYLEILKILPKYRGGGLEPVGYPLNMPLLFVPIALKNIIPLKFADICEISDGMANPLAIRDEALSGEGIVNDDSAPVDARPGGTAWHPLVPSDNNYPSFTVDLTQNGNPTTIEEIGVMVMILFQWYMYHI